MDGALKKKGISLSMQYLNETPLAQINKSKMKKKLLSIILLLLVLSASSAQGTIEEGWKLWSKAELEKAEKIAESNIDTDEG